MSDRSMSDRPVAYQQRVSTFWWLHRRSYLLFVLRELTCVFVAWSVVFLLLLVHAVNRGDASYRSFLDWAGSPWVVALNIVTFAFLVFHSVTWFALSSKAISVWVRGRKVPDVMIAGPNYTAWAVVSAAVAWLVLRGR